MVGFARLIRPTYAEANVGHPSNSYWLFLGGWRAQKQNGPQLLLRAASFPPNQLAPFVFPAPVVGVGFIVWLAIILVRRFVVFRLIVGRGLVGVVVVDRGLIGVVVVGRMISV